MMEKHFSHALLPFYFLAMEKPVFKMWGVKLNACVLARWLLSHFYCFLFLRTWPSPPQWIRKNLTNPPSFLAVEFAVPLLFTRQQLFPPKAQKKPASHKWQLKSEALSYVVWESVKEKLYIVVIFLHLGSCVSHQFQRTEICSSNQHQKLHKSIVTLQCLHTVIYSV